MKNIEIKDYNINIELKPFINIIGLPASGKSTVLKMLINQVYNPNIFIDGKKLEEYPLEFKRQNLAAALHNFTFNTKDVKTELLYYQDILNIELEDSIKQIKLFVKYFGLSDLIESKIEYLTKGEQALIKILSLLIIKPKLLGIDTLMEYLTKEQKLKVVKYAKENKISILNVTSEPEELLLGTHIMVISDFKMIAYDTTKDILENESLLLEAGFDLPFIVNISSGLKSYNLLDKTYFDNESVVGELWK